MWWRFQWNSPGPRPVKTWRNRVEWSAARSSSERRSMTTTSDITPSIYNQIKKDIQSDYFQQKYVNDGQRFVAWYVHNIHGRDIIETREDVTDGPDDQQIDAIVVDDDNTTVYVIQGKFVGESTVDASAYDQ